MITDHSISLLSRAPALQVETSGKKNAEDQWANSQGRREWRTETRYFSSKMFHRIKPKGIMCMMDFSLNRRALTHRKVGKYKEDYTRLKKRHRLKSQKETEIWRIATRIKLTHVMHT